MGTVARSIDTYCPIEDLDDRYPDWTFQVVADLPHDASEVFLPQRKHMILSKEKCEADAQMFLAHVVAHLDLHRIGGPFSKAQEDEASMVAALRLDRPSMRDGWPDIDGNPTVPWAPLD